MTGLRETGVRAAYAAAAVAAVTTAGAAGTAFGLHRPETLCPLRALTGVPCPFCGTTTAAERLADGQPLAALAANPVTVLAVVALVLAPALRHRLPRSVPAPVFTAVVLTAWVWQLARFDLMPA